jgi:PAS domain S-box-containing protein
VLSRLSISVSEPVSRWGAPLLGLVGLAALVVVDLALGRDAAIAGTFAAAPFLTATLGGPRATAVVAAAATAAAFLSGLWNDDFGAGDWWARLCAVAVAGLVAILAARAAALARTGMFRLRLLDRVGRIADGALPLAETLDRVTEAVVPAYADVCMVDAIRDGDVQRIATRATGPDTEKVERAIRLRTPSTPDWLRDPDSDSLEPHFVPSMPDEVLRRMANDPKDLEFLRWLRPSCYIVAPLVSRGRSLGALTVVRRQGSPRMTSEDVEFVTALASRIGIALDNAGLFSDLESVERRMDSVMENVGEAVLVHDTSGRIVYSNPAAEDAPEVSGADGRTVGSLELRDEAGDPLDPERLPRRRVLAGEAPPPLVYRIHDTDSGQESWRRERSTPIAGPAGDVLYAVTTIQDVTAVKEAEFGQRVLADSAEAVASAADYEGALGALSRAVVPELADWCSVNVPNADGTIERVAVADEDPAMLALDDRLRDGMEVRPGLRLAMADVLRASKPVTAELPDPAPGWVLLKPIRAGGGAIGVMTLVNRPGRHAFSTEEIRLARAVADRAGVAILNAKLAGERAVIAETLQRELLPPLLPEVEGWSMAAMYRPAGEQNRAGGDFYDVFEGADGWVVVLGDVEGHGAEAAAVTAMVRYTIRTVAMTEGELLTAFDILNTQLRSREPARLCSVVCVGFGARSDATVVSAGHPLPMLVAGDGIREVGLPGSLLGALEEPQWSPVRFDVEAGEELVLYTDGVVEARRDGQRFGRERLGSLLTGVGGPGDAVQRVGDEIDAFVETNQDDAAMVVLRREQAADVALATESLAGRVK